MLYIFQHRNREWEHISEELVIQLTKSNSVVFIQKEIYFNGQLSHSEISW